MEVKGVGLVEGYMTDGRADSPSTSSEPISTISEQMIDFGTRKEEEDLRSMGEH